MHLVHVGSRTINLANVSWINHDARTARNLSPETGPAVEIHFGGDSPLLLKGEDAAALTEYLDRHSGHGVGLRITQLHAGSGLAGSGCCGNGNSRDAATLARIAATEAALASQLGEARDGGQP